MKKGVRPKGIRLREKKSSTFYVLPRRYALGIVPNSLRLWIVRPANFSALRF